MNTMEKPDCRHQKTVLRRGFTASRSAMTTAAAGVAGAAVAQHLLALPAFAEATLVHAYVSSLRNELATHGIIERSLSLGKRVIVPAVLPGTRILRHAQISGLDELVPDRWGLLGPDMDQARWLEDLSAIELILVPGLAFDRRGNRLGMGGGYYDRFLDATTATRVGLTYDEMLVDALPTEPHDARMDMVIAPSEVWPCADG
jgi:5-formyltetrahydrofolate cyclo-ligase